MSLLPVEEAQARLLAMASPLPACPAPLAEAAGRYLAEPLAAARDQPWTDLSAMDGYAVRHADMPGPWRVVGEMAAGAVPGRAPLGEGEAMRIFTGAPLPPGADTVVVQEDVHVDGTLVRLTGEGPGGRGRHVRPRASDFAQGATLLPAGIRLGPAQVALAALAGYGAMPLGGRPRISILSTGSELVPPGAPCSPGRLPASNGVMLRAMAEGAGATVAGETLVPDDLGLLTQALRHAAEADEAHVIVTSGGASVGDHDLVRPALEAAGGSIDFWRIAMRPGKPLIVGRIGGAILLGLPGNPVSAMVTGALFLLPLVRHLAGAAEPLPRTRDAMLAVDMPAVGGRTDFVRATVAGETVTPIAFQDSAAMHAAARANALIVRPADSPASRAGEKAPILDWPALGLAG
ncbi:gephyrin-like molybdotransferase Glp [Sphingobium lignivorans]|uniref:Molybdopterin molybdenumtransferase n=1 Tax=Sphingobium lignivorans TaxID=2735886 RepID=A0ABR6NGV7_9SPHN|nr:gephyrin-like molybdotransferase Glp [Sphingobium lignivorans]MBB5986515.1 molybdopterin molybdotransferase [Sphingobium lignivorans]